MKRPAKISASKRCSYFFFDDLGGCPSAACIWTLRVRIVIGRFACSADFGSGSGAPCSLAAKFTKQQLVAKNSSLIAFISLKQIAPAGGFAIVARRALLALVFDAG